MLWPAPPWLSPATLTPGPHLWTEKSAHISRGNYHSRTFHVCVQRYVTDNKLKSQLLIKVTAADLPVSMRTKRWAQSHFTNEEVKDENVQVVWLNSQWIAGLVFPDGTVVKNLPVIQARKILWTEEPGGLQSMELQRVGHDLATEHTSKQQVWGWSPGLPSHRAVMQWNKKSGSPSKIHFTGKHWLSSHFVQCRHVD